MRKLTTEEKRYRKSVIFNDEIKMLQEKINSLGLSSLLTIKKLMFDYNKSQHYRTLCLVFNETFSVVDANSSKPRKINKWASVNMQFDGSGTKHNGITISNIFCRGGVVYHDKNNHIEDEDIRKVCDMLANEYFLWVHWTDYHVSYDIEMSKKRNGGTIEPNAYGNVQYFMYLMWKRLDVAFDGTFTHYSLSELIQKYNEQVERGLIVDSPFADGRFPFESVDEEDIPDDELKRCGPYG